MVIKKNPVQFAVSLLSVICLIIMYFFAVFGALVQKPWITVVVAVIIALLILMLIISYFKNNEKIFKIAVNVSIATVVLYGIYFIILKTDLIGKITSFDTLRLLIKSTGLRGVIIFCIILILQVVLLPIPSSVTILAGTVIYGSALTFLISTIGVVIGSLISFTVGRIFGKKLVNLIFGDESVNKYANILDDKGSLLLFLMLLLPFFPDDLLCMLAGITNISYKKFIVIAFASRAIGVACLAFFGSGSIIPFNTGWGIATWILIATALISLYIIYSKNKTKVNKFLNKIHFLNKLK